MRPAIKRILSTVVSTSLLLDPSIGAAVRHPGPPPRPPTVIAQQALMQPGATFTPSVDRSDVRLIQWRPTNAAQGPTASLGLSGIPFLVLGFGIFGLALVPWGLLAENLAAALGNLHPAKIAALLFGLGFAATALINPKEPLTDPERVYAVLQEIPYPVAARELLMIFLLPAAEGTRMEALLFGLMDKGRVVKIEEEGKYYFAPAERHPLPSLPVDPRLEALRLDELGLRVANLLRRHPGTAWRSQEIRLALDMRQNTISNSRFEHLFRKQTIALRQAHLISVVETPIAPGAYSYMWVGDRPKVEAPASTDLALHSEDEASDEKGRRLLRPGPLHVVEVHRAADAGRSAQWLREADFSLDRNVLVESPLYAREFAGEKASDPARFRFSTLVMSDNGSLTDEQANEIFRTEIEQEPIHLILTGDSLHHCIATALSSLAGHQVRLGVHYVSYHLIGTLLHEAHPDSGGEEWEEALAESWIEKASEEALRTVDQAVRRPGLITSIFVDGLRTFMKRHPGSPKHVAKVYWWSTIEAAKLAFQATPSYLGFSHFPRLEIWESVGVHLNRTAETILETISVEEYLSKKTLRKRRPAASRSEDHTEVDPNASGPGGIIAPLVLLLLSAAGLDRIAEKQHQNQPVLQAA
jgi:hypothetical protein